MSRTYNESFTELGQFELDPASIRMLPMIFCQRHRVAVLGRVEPEKATPVYVGMLNPDDTLSINQIEALLRRPIHPVRLNLYEINKAIQTGFTRYQETDHVIRIDALTPGIPQTIPHLLDRVLADAVLRHASDIHIETYNTDVDLRYRVNGILHQVFTHINPDNVSELTSRIKIMAGMDISERRRPQDGRFSCRFIEGDQRWTVDFRVSVVPSPAGEDTVLRVLDSSVGLINVRELGMEEQTIELLLRVLDNPEGLILVTGPTGSGKTTTLYAAIGHICDGARKIITAEDPIEYYLPKVNQKQITPVMGMQDLLRAMLRQDPDVMLFGEIRDQETGETAIMAAATGHIVLGTLHTADALGAVMRLRGLELDDTDIAASLLAVLAQRLVRTLCPACKQPAPPTEQQKGIFGSLLDEVKPYGAVGCDACYGTGYTSRIGLFELLLVDEALQDQISDGASKGQLRRHAYRQGFRSMVADGLNKVHQGLTTLDELIRVLPFREIVATRNAQASSSRSKRARNAKRVRPRPQPRDANGAAAHGDDIHDDAIIPIDVADPIDVPEL